MGYKERVESLSAPFSVKELENFLFKGDESFTSPPLEYLKMVKASHNLETIKDELLTPEQNPVIRKLFRFKSIYPKSLVVTIIDFVARENFSDLDKRRWDLTPKTPELLAELIEKLIQKHGFNGIIERFIASPTQIEREISYQGVKASFELCWKENNIDHMLSIVGSHHAPYGSGPWVEVRTQDFSEYLLTSDKREISQNKIEEILAHAFLKSEYDSEKEKRDLEEAEREAKKAGAAMVPTGVSFGSLMPHTVFIWKPPDRL